MKRHLEGKGWCRGSQAVTGFYFIFNLSRVLDAALIPGTSFALFFEARASIGEDMVRACVHLVQHTHKQTRSALLCARLYS